MGLAVGEGREIVGKERGLGGFSGAVGTFEAEEETAGGEWEGGEEGGGRDGGVGWGGGHFLVVLGAEMGYRTLEVGLVDGG